MAESKRDRSRRIRRANRELRNFGKINWEYYDHPRLYNMIMEANLRDMSHRAGEWRRIAEGIEETTKAVENSLRSLMNNWRGAAAVAGAGAGTRLTQWAGDASHTATRIAAAMADYTEAVETAQHRMPSPVFAGQEQAFRDGHGATVPDGPAAAVMFDRLLTDYQPGFEKARENKAEAVRVMEDYESRSREIYTPLPHFEPSPALPGGQDDAAPGVVPGTPLPPPARPHDPPVGAPAGPPESATDAEGGGPGQTTTSGFTDPPRGPNPGPGGLPPNPATAPGPGGADSYRGGPGSGGGFGPGGGFGATPGGGAGAGPLAARGPGGAVPGAAGVFGGRGPGGAAGAAGGGLYPPMGGAGAPGDEDKEHKNKYDKGLDLLDDLPPAYPPVFGV
ncbi:PPE domain-containing protein [Actinophytocola sp.]|uniref:PPE domain-containing protein n=1 Tax=Actinophytocola sp. TaxID=1872138 RepID=UPI002D7E16FC|nr:PPE domain-containing protein [Actinophytocola sp.]HET9138696.1 PPE domain-containing protein [Actinophytocola sp.]